MSERNADLLETQLVAARARETRYRQEVDAARTWMRQACDELAAWTEIARGALESPAAAQAVQALIDACPLPPEEAEHD
jgi:hypothetical protein